MDNNEKQASQQCCDKALLTQWQVFNERLTKQLQGVDTVLAIGGGLIVGSLSFGIHEGADFVIFFLPFLVYALVAYWLIKVNELHVTGAYISKLEELLNKQCSELFLWEKLIPEKFSILILCR